MFAVDIFVVQGIQLGRQAPSFDGEYFGPEMDQPTHCYHNWVAGKITAYIVGSNETNLNASILATHARSDHLCLVRLYTKAANLAHNQHAECFFSTYAHIFALELGHTSQNAIYTRLTSYGRE